MAVLLQLRPDMAERDQISHLKEQLEVYLNSQERDILALLGEGRGQGSAGGATSYEQLTGLPSIEGVTLRGNKTYEDLNLKGLTNLEIEALLD